MGWTDNDGNLLCLEEAPGDLESQWSSDEFYNAALIQDLSTAKGELDDNHELVLELESSKGVRGAVTDSTQVIYFLSNMNKSRS